MTMSGAALLDTLREHRVLDEDALDRLDIEFRTPPDDGGHLADELRRRGMLSAFQIGYLLLGRPQDLILGQYVLVDRLGEGGMGQVFKAFHRVLKSLRAIKVIRPDCITSKATVRRFYREVELVARLKHPNIIHAYDAAQDGERHYFVMEYAAGQDLAHVIKQRGPLPVGEACDYIRQAALGLQHAHEHGLVHRDIKPSNLLLSTEDGCIKVLDLGLAKLREGGPEGDDAGRPMTPAGMMMGTPDFMAPEQAENSASADIRADIYSLGCSLYQLLTGRVPFPTASLVEKLTKHYAEKPVPLDQFRGDLPSGLQAILDRMMAKLPEQRYQTPSGVAVALAPYCTVGASIAPPGESGATLAPGTRIGAPSILPPGASGPTAQASVEASYIPQTMQLPPDALRGTQPAPKSSKDAKDARTVMMTEAPYSLTEPPPDTAIGPMTPRTAPRPPAAPPTRKPWLVIGGVGLVAAALVVVGIQSGWFGKSNTDSGERVVNRDDVRKTDDIHPVQDKDIVKPADKDIVKPTDQNGTKDDKKTDRVNPIPVTRGPLGVAKKFDGASLGQVGKVKNGKGDDTVVIRGLERPREDWQKPAPISPLVPDVVQVAFSADGRRAIVRTKFGLYAYDVRSKAPPDTISLLQIFGNRVAASPTIGEAALSADGERIVFATISTTDKPVRGQVKQQAEYDTLAIWNYSRLQVCYGEIATPRDGMVVPNTRCLAVAPDGLSILAGADRQVNRWAVSSSVAQSDEPATRYEAGAGVECVAVSPDGKHVVAGLETGGLRVFRLDKKDDAGRDFEERNRYVRVVTFLSNTRFVSGHSMGQVCIWELNGGANQEKPAPPRFTRDGWHSRHVTAVAGKGDVFATGSLDGELALGQISETKPDWKGKLDGSPVKALLFAPDGSSLLYATDKFLGRLPLIAPSPAADKPAKDEPSGLGKKEILRD